MYYFIHLYSCFISDIRVFFGVFLGPILALVLFNMVVFVIVLRVLLHHCRRKVGDLVKMKKAQATFRTFISVVLISFMFGLQWVFGAFTISKASVVFQWLFVIFSTLQGFFLFLYFCVFTDDAREEWLNLLSCGRRKGRKRAVSLSVGNRREKNSASSYSTSHNPESSTLRRGVHSSSISGDSIVEKDPRQMRNILLAMPTSISEDIQSEVIENKTADDALDNTSDQTVDLVSDHPTDLEPPSKAPMFEVPEHVIERRRFTFHRNPAANSPSKAPMFEVPEHVTERRRFTFHCNPAANSPTLDNLNPKRKDKGNDEASLPSVTDFGELTQLTDLTILTNSDVSGAEDITCV